MYAPLLSNRYLTSKIIPLTAVGAVALCVALVIIVVSVMTGFLDMVRSSGKTLIGDVILSRDITGIPYYDELIGEIEALPEASAACAVVETYGLLQMPYGTDDGGSRIETVQVWGIEPGGFDAVTDYASKLYWRRPTPEEEPTLLPDDPRLDERYHREEDGLAMRRADGEEGIVLGIEISPFNRRASDGTYRTENPFGAQDYDYFMPNQLGARLTLVPVSSSASLGGEKKRQFAIVNEFESGVYQIDAQRILAPLGAIQEMLLLDEAPLTSRTEFDEDGRPLVIGTTPARATTILVRAAEGTSPTDLRDAVREIYDRFASRIAGDASRPVTMPGAVTIATWEERLSDLIGPVEKERELMRTLFSIVYIVCAVLVLAIFWAIVQEKTRDIGILRAIGASRRGILWIFLRYGLLIGVVGSALGVGVAWLTVSHINDIHAALGDPAPLWARIAAWTVAALAIGLAVRGAWRASALQFVTFLYLGFGLSLAAVALALHRGFLIWDPSVYYFSTIPSAMDVQTAVITAVGGVVFSVIGASIPAARAADTEVVQSLRYE